MISYDTLQPQSSHRLPHPPTYHGVEFQHPNYKQFVLNYNDYQQIHLLNFFRLVKVCISRFHSRNVSPIQIDYEGGQLPYC